MDSSFTSPEIRITKQGVWINKQEIAPAVGCTRSELLVRIEIALGPPVLALDLDKNAGISSLIYSTAGFSIIIDDNGVQSIDFDLLTPAAKEAGISSWFTGNVIAGGRTLPMGAHALPPEPTLSPLNARLLEINKGVGSGKRNHPDVEFDYNIQIGSTLLWLVVHAITDHIHMAMLKPNKS